MENEITELIDREFINWLREKPNNSIVGTPTAPCGCPLFKFLTEKRKEFRGVGSSMVVIEGGEEFWTKIPDKIASFIRNLIRIYGEDEITAEQALFVWERM
jgi:hypothetical protein